MYKEVYIMQLFENEWIFIDDIIYKFNSSKDLDSARLNFLETIKGLISYDSATFWLADKNNPGAITSPILCNFLPEYAQEYTELYMDTDYAKWLFTSSQSRAYKSSDWFPPGVFEETTFYKSFYQKCNIHFAIMLSLSFNNKFIGIIFLYRSSEKKDFTEKDLFILDILKKHLSLKIYNCEFSNENNCNSEAAIFTKPRQLKTLYDKYSLTPREQEITSLLLNGLPISEIADMLIISESTLRTHFTNIYRKLNISRRSELIKVFSDADCSDMTE